jgi:hypothetical protein
MLLAPIIEEVLKQGASHIAYMSGRGTLNRKLMSVNS